MTEHSLDAEGPVTFLPATTRIVIYRKYAGMSSAALGGCSNEMRGTDTVGLHTEFPGG